ncbi:hypothetical protein ABOM_001479 [Aspergillus bombycis]|uniref:Uncharacterized protein n=1 Tax=Aspergillus bombycis TaxID=109264 RepID=A0A1F8ADQ7_9EURO|nr:hypothetical protein ABOM_001479 [Aspergillus bombycis]OGM49863.1 hypothetical protein ABOM_001479 [Aspergillus bombycis]
MKLSTILAATTALLTGANAAVPRLAEVHSTDICWRVCFPEKPHCPDGWHDKKFGSDEDDDSLTSKLDLFWQA